MKISCWKIASSGGTMLGLYITYNITYNITHKGWEKMFEKEIKKVKNRTTFTITLGKNDGDIHEGTCFIYYPHEIEEIQLNISRLEEENQSLTSQLEEMASKNKNLETQLNLQSNKHESQQKIIQRLEDANSKKDEEISQLKSNIDDLNEERNGLNTTIITTRIQHEEEMERLNHEFGDLVSKYNESVDMIHSLISTTTLMKSDIENMGVINRNIGFKKHVNNIFEERNLDILIEQHLIEEDSTIPKKLPNKHP